MVPPIAQAAGAAVWGLVRRQHGVVARRQLLALGYAARAIDHRLATGRLHLVYRGVYAVGRPELTARGRWMAAVLSCGPEAMLSHRSAAALWGIATSPGGRIDVSVPARARLRRTDVAIHRRGGRALATRSRREGIPVTSPVLTIIDLATELPPGRLEAIVNEADKLEVADPERLRSALWEWTGQPGVSALRRLLDRATFSLTDSELERRFLPLARGAGLPTPSTQQLVSGFRVDFFWPELGLVVETDGLRYHRTPTQQARDTRRDHAHATAGLTSLRFTHGQIRYEPRYVRASLAAVALRLRSPRQQVEH